MSDLVTILDNRSNLSDGVIEKFDSGVAKTHACVEPQFAT